MAEGSMISWKEKWLNLRKRHAGHVERAGESLMMVGQSILTGGVGISMGVVDQKMAPAESAYPNLGMVKVGPVPLSLALGTAGLGLAIYGHGKRWAPFAEAAGAGAIAAYGYAQGRRMTIDWMKTTK